MTLDTTLNTTVESDALNESLGTRGEAYWKNRALAAEVKLAEEVKGRAQDNQSWREMFEAATAPFRRFFEIIKKPTRGNSGQCREYSNELQAFSIRLLGCGIAASDIRKMFVALDEHFHLCDGVITRIPKADYFVKLRAKVPVLSLKQDAEVVSTGLEFAISFDSTSMNSRSHVSLGCYNENVKFHCLDIRDIEGKKVLKSPVSCIK